MVAPQRLGRYVLYETIASGGMASVHLGRSLGDAGFARTVAIKRLHPHLAADQKFVTMFMDEARLAARVQHPNVVATLDVVSAQTELFVVMELVPGVSLARLQHGGAPVPWAIASALGCGMLWGLHAAHEARDEQGRPLELVHRDVSPQNVLVGADGVPRLIDFGVAKAASRLQTTRDGQVKGKLAYMAPEQLESRPVDRRADVYAAGVVLWELFAGRRMLDAPEMGALVKAVVAGDLPSLDAATPGLPPALTACIHRALAREPEGRFANAAELARALHDAVPPAAPHEVAEWVRGLAAADLAGLARRVAEIEAGADAFVPVDVVTPERQRLLANAATASVTVPSPAARRSRKPVAAAVLAVAVGLTTAGVWLVQRETEPAPAPATAPPAVVAREAPAPAPVEAPAPPPEPVKPAAAPAPVRTRAQSRKASPRCDPPTYVDAAGIRRVKDGCF